MGGEIEELRCAFIACKTRGSVHVIPGSFVGIGEICEVEIDHTPACGGMDGSVDVVVVIVVCNGGVFDTLYGVSAV